MRTDTNVDGDHMAAPSGRPRPPNASAARHHISRPMLTSNSIRISLYLIELVPPTVSCSLRAEIAAATSASRVGKSRNG